MADAPLKPLPAADDEFWQVGKESAAIGIHKVKKASCETHQWRQYENEAECLNCHIGYYLGPGGYVKDKHIYIKDTRVI